MRHDGHTARVFASALAIIPNWEEIQEMTALVIAVLGLLSTLSGVVITQRSSDRREALQWTRMREREREQWAREDSLRTFEQRRISYLEFEEQLRSAALAVSDTRSRSALEDEWQVPVFQSLLRLEVFGTPETTAAAVDAYDALLRWSDTSGASSYYAETAYDKAHDKVITAIRKDLRIDTPGTDVDQST